MLKTVIVRKRPTEYALAGSERDRPQPGSLRALLDTGVIGPLETARHRIEEVHDGPVGPQQRGCRLHGSLQQLAAVADRGEARRQLAQRLLRGGSPRDLDSGRRDLPDQPRVGNRHGRVTRQRPDERLLGLAELVGPTDIRAERAHRLIADDDRRDDHRANAEVAGDRVGLLRVPEPLVGEVVARDVGDALRHRQSEQSIAQRQLQALPGTSGCARR